MKHCNITEEQSGYQFFVYLFGQKKNEEKSKHHPSRSFSISHSLISSYY